MNRFQELQNKHVELLRRYETNKASADFIKDVRAYVEQVLNASREISDSRERNQLRANLRFWGAYIYDRTGVYPNLSLLPSEATAETSALKAAPLNGRGIAIAAILLLAVIGLGGFLILRGINQPYSQQPPTTNTPINPTSLFASPVGQTPSMSDVEAFATATALALTSSTKTPTPVSTPTPIPSPESIGLVPRLGYSSGTCSDRTIEMGWRDFKWDTGQLPDSSEIRDAVAYLSSLGTGEIVSRVNVVPNGESTLLELGETTADESYLLQVRHPLFLFEPIIIQFTSDCAHNRLSVTYGGESPVVDNLTLDVDLGLVDWGPDPTVSADAWIAQLSIQAEERGIYRYNSALITDKTFFVAGSACSTIPFRLSRLSQGKYQGVLISLYIAGPLCSKTE